MALAGNWTQYDNWLANAENMWARQEGKPLPHKHRYKLPNSREHWIKKARETHGDKYDYSLVPPEFTSKDKVPIICPIHGVFYQNSSNHIFKSGCRACGRLIQREKVKGKSHNCA